MKKLLGRLGGRLVDAIGTRVQNDAEEAQRHAPATKAALRALYLGYRRGARAGTLPGPDEVGFRVFSQFDEDGVLLYLLGAAGIESGRFIELGGGDGLTGSNCANLAINLGFHGLFVDASERAVARGRRYYSAHPDTSLYPPAFAHARLTRENVNRVLEEHGFTGAVDVLSIDVDGNDLWIWDALECVSPRIVVAETHPEFGERSLVVPYQPEWTREASPHPEYFGASPAAMTRLARRRGYRLVATNRFGFNVFYLRDDVAADLVPALPLEAVFRHPRNRERARLFEQIRHLPFVTFEP